MPKKNIEYLEVDEEDLGDEEDLEDEEEDLGDEEEGEEEENLENEDEENLVDEEEGDEENLEEDLGEEEEENLEEEKTDKDYEEIDSWLMKELGSSLTIFVIGDPHFRSKYVKEGEDLITRSIEMAKNISPDMIVVLGDVLDTMEVSRLVPFRQAERFIKGLSGVTKTFILMGNHDLMNKSQFLTGNHFFGPFKKWKNVYIIDKPMYVTIKDTDLVLCPYVPTGRFIEALNTLLDEEKVWQNAACIFAHQEFKGSVFEDKGDKWSSKYPPVISGHIHDACQIGDNIYYPGSPLQVDFNENPDKKVWVVSFDNDGMQIDKRDLGLKLRKEVDITYAEIDTFDFAMLDAFYVKLKVHATHEQIKIFKSSKLYKKMVELSIKVTFIAENPDIAPLLDSKSFGKKITFETIMVSLVKNKPKHVRDAYDSILQRETNIRETNMRETSITEPVIPTKIIFH